MAGEEFQIKMIARRRIAVVDDETDILDLISIHLNRAGFNVMKFENSTTFLNALKTDVPDLVILDLMLPDIHGTEVCRMIRSSDSTAHLPIIMLTAMVDESDKVAGLEMGADDYVSKPFSPRELVARVKAVLRRNITEETDQGIITVNDSMIIDTDRFTVFVNGVKTDLTSTEFKLLQALARGRGRVFPRSRLLDILWQGEKYVTERTIDVHIAHLRSKLGEAGNLIENVRGIGYKLSENN
jgi:DNA-binding response OmpR family regulator